MAQELSLAGNQLTHLPDDISKLAYLQKLQLSGNYLESLPDSLCDLTELEVILIATSSHTDHHDCKNFSAEDSLPRLDAVSHLPRLLYNCTSNCLCTLLQRTCNC